MAASAISFAVPAAVTRAQIPLLCSDLAELVRDRGCGVVLCDVAEVTRPDVVTVEALARLRLTARRHGWRMVVSGAGPDLIDLLHLIGLTEVIPRSGEAGNRR